MTIDWEIISSVSTLIATGVALWLGMRGVRMSHRDTARKIGTWVTQRYDFDDTTDCYMRSIQLHISNESDEPVFDVNVVVFTGVETKEYAVGPLSAPTPIQVIAPRQQLDFDITTGIQAYSDTWKLMAEVNFTDGREIRWLRDRNGHLSKMRGKGKLVNRNTTMEQDLTDLGIQSDQRNSDDLSWLLNPIAVTCTFLTVLNDDAAFTNKSYEPLLANEATGWESTDWDKCRENWAKLLPTNFVQYPAPRIAQIKLADPQFEGKQVVNGTYLFQAKIVTLTLGTDGWKIFGIGHPLPPEQILLPHMSAPVGSQ